MPLYSIPQDLTYDFYQERFDEDHVHLRFAGRLLEFEASPQSLTIRIPAALRAVIREPEETAVELETADKTDDELMEPVEREVSDRIASFQKNPGEGQSFRRSFPLTGRRLRFYLRCGGRGAENFKSSMG